MASSETAFSAWSSLGSPAAVEVLARTGFDAMTLDCQHGLWHVGNLAEGIAAAKAAGLPVAVRVPLNGFAETSRALDLGADTIIAPMVSSAGEARLYADVAKYPPLGARSWGPNRALTLSGVRPSDYLAGANRSTTLLVMIETAAAIDALDDILAVDGVDGVFVGPSDLGVTLSRGERIDPAADDVFAASKEIAERARSAGKATGVFAMTAEAANTFADMGYGFIAVGTDALLLRAGASAARAVLTGRLAG